jgi:hypothetical protein
VDGQSLHGVLLGSRVFSWFSGVLCAEVDDARDSCWRRCFAVLLYLAVKPAHMGVDVDGLVCPLHHPMSCDRQMRGHGLLLGVVLPLWGM